MIKISRRKKKKKQKAAHIATSDRLAEVLENLNDPRLREMINRARAGYYDDYKSRIAHPISELVKDLESFGYHELASRAKNGEWDAQQWETRQWMLREGVTFFTDFLNR